MIILELEGGEEVVSNINYLLDEKLIQHSIKPKVYISTTQFVRSIDYAKKIVSSDCGTPKVPEYLTKVFPQSANKIEGFKTGYALHWPHMGEIKDSFSIYVDDRGDIHNECDHLDNTVTIRWNGDVEPCCYDLTSKLVMGNILKEKLVDILNGDKYSILKKSIKNKKFISICKECAVVTPKRYLIPKW